jgi:hypothetical protein
MKSAVVAMVVATALGGTVAMSYAQSSKSEKLKPFSAEPAATAGVGTELPAAASNPKELQAGGSGGPTTASALASDGALASSGANSSMKSQNK